MNIKNIWKDIKKVNGYYVLEEDKKDLNILSKYFDLTKIPEPRLGNINSKILILSGNPNIKSKTGITHQERLDSLKNHYSNHLCINHSKDDWWQKRFKDWVKILTTAKKVNDNTSAYNILSENICTLEFYPYSSKKFPKKEIKLESHKYQKAIIKNAINNNAAIIITRARVNWFYLYEGLENYNKLYFLSSHESSYFTVDNIFTKSEYEMKYNRKPEDIKSERDQNQSPLLDIMVNANLI